MCLFGGCTEQTRTRPNGVVVKGSDCGLADPKAGRFNAELLHFFVLFFYGHDLNALVQDVFVL